jgi:tRNA 2-thiouridine synthesizing protein A
MRYMAAVMDASDPDRIYDATGLLCPLPVLRANRVLRDLAPGGTLKVLATDPAAEADFPAYCRQTGHTLIASGREGDVLVFLIRKKGA